MRRRARHYIRPNTTSKRPQQIAFVGLDVNREQSGAEVAETFRSAFVLYYRRGDAYKPERLEAERFDDPAGLWRWLSLRVRRRSRMIVVALNPERLLVASRGFETLREEGWKLGYPISTSRLSWIPWRNGDRTLLLVAHRNLFNFVPPPGGDAEAQARGMAGSWLDLLALMDERDLGDFRLTIGSQAMQIYRHRFLEHPILIHAVRHVDELERRACAGAFYQPLFAGQAPAGRYHYVDVNAMYPWCMATFVMPWRLAGHSGPMRVSMLEKKLNRYLVVAMVRIRTDVPRYPLRTEDRTIYPVGEFTTVLTTPDLWTAIEAGHVREVLAAAWYDGARLFRRFVETLWRWRRDYQRQGETMKARLCKAWAVALYGRWGAWRYERVHEADVDRSEVGSGVFIDLESGQQHQYFCLDGKMWTNRKRGVVYDGFPAIMAHTAAYGRRRMFELVEQAGPRHTYVVLSDGLIVDDAGLEALEDELDPDRLGALKRKRTADYLEVRSDTEFILGERRWLSGVKDGAVEVEDGVFVVHLEPRLGLLLQRGELDRYVLEPREIRVERAIRCGTVLPSGWIAPHVVGARVPSPPAPYALSLASPPATSCTASHSLAAALVP